MNHDKGIKPSRNEFGVATAPTLSAADEISDLRQDVTQLNTLLGEKN